MVGNFVQNLATCNIIYVLNGELRTMLNLRPLGIGDRTSFFLNNYLKLERSPISKT